jgi:hypothetical protein
MQGSYIRDDQAKKYEGKRTVKRNPANRLPGGQLGPGYDSNQRKSPNRGENLTQNELILKH